VWLVVGCEVRRNVEEQSKASSKFNNENVQRLLRRFILSNIPTSGAHVIIEFLEAMDLHRWLILARSNDSTEGLRESGVSSQRLSIPGIALSFMTHQSIELSSGSSSLPSSL
jgi:hypothetical protein